MAKIENEIQYAWAEQRVEQLLPLIREDMPTDDPTYIEFVLLSGLVADYSEEHYAVGEPALVDVIKLRMEEKDLSENDLATMLGISVAEVTNILLGTTEPTLKVARVISKGLDIDPDIVLGV